MNQNDVNDVPLLTDREYARQVGQRFSFARQYLGLTTQVLAELLGTSGAKITEVEQGKSFLPIPWIEKLYRFLGVNASWLLTGDKQVTMAKTLFYDDLVYHLQVPEVEQFIMTKFCETKTLFKDRIREYERFNAVSLSGGPQ